MYQKMYHILFNAITNAIEKLEWQDYQAAMALLEADCLDAEDVYMMQGPELSVSSKDTPPSVCCPMWCLQNGSPEFKKELAQMMGHGLDDDEEEEEEP